MGERSLDKPQFVSKEATSGRIHSALNQPRSQPIEEDSLPSTIGARHAFADRSPVGSEMAGNAPTASDKFLAHFEKYGTLLRLFRKRAQLTQRQLGKIAKQKNPQAYIANLENGVRYPPSPEVNALLARKMRLTEAETELLKQAAIVGSVRGPQSRKAEQVGLTLHSDLLGSGDIGVAFRSGTVWSIGELPEMTGKGPPEDYLAVMCESIRNGRASFVYWIPADNAGKFDDLRRHLENELQKEGRSNLVYRHLEAIIAPQVVTIMQLVVHNPLSHERQMLIGLADTPKIVQRYFPLSGHSARKLVDLLEPVYNQLITEHESEVDGLRFRRHFPSATS
jgi:transcriptional regulator with XRE-family HTH domain